jgi:hypothetical protein
MTLRDALIRISTEVEARGHYTISLLAQVHPAEYLDLCPPPGEGLLTRLQRWRRRRFQGRLSKPGPRFIPFMAVTLDEAGAEILLWLGQPPVPSLTTDGVVSVSELSQVLAAHSEHHGAFQLEAAVFWREGDQRRGIQALRLDWPILGIGIDDDSATFGLVAGPGWSPPG